MKVPVDQCGRAARCGLVAVLAMLLGACAAPSKPAAPSVVTPPAAPLMLVPMPASIQRAPGSLILRDGAPLIVSANDAAAQAVATDWADRVESSVGLRLDRHPATTSPGVEFALEAGGTAQDEHYALAISERGARISAKSPRGLFYGGVTLWQLLTADSGATPSALPLVVIDDGPRFAWRGLMLDSARHFLPPDAVRRFIDEMALHKYNVLQWHLTDDQGWRIEIKKYPRLTSVGAWRKTPGTGATYGGFYTQDEIRDIVRYAAQRYVTIVPEIEMPGHAQAAIAAYPQLGVTGKAPPVSSDWGVHTYLYNVEDSTFSFLEDVLTETMALFPSPYLHIGGDEAAKDQWQASPRVRRRMRELGIKDEAALQGWFTARIGRFLAAHGRKLVGWDEILEGGVSPSATVMSWRGVQGAIDAARAGHDIVMAPSPVLYFDHLQTNAPSEPAGRPDVVSLRDVYTFDPVPAQLDAAQARRVLGAQGNLWSEYLTSPALVEHAAFPRAAALAEVLWSQSDRRDWNSFSQRLPAQLDRYRRAGIAFGGVAAVVESGNGSELRRDSDQLKPCTNGLALRILANPDDPAPKRVYRVDLMNPCWIYTAADLRDVARITVRAVPIPYYYQLWHDAAKVVVRKPTHGVDELQVRLDDCDGPVFATVPLRGRSAAAESLKVPISGRDGVHDLCVNFATRKNDPFWVIESVELVPAQR